MRYLQCLQFSLRFVYFWPLFFLAICVNLKTTNRSASQELRQTYAGAVQEEAVTAQMNDLALPARKGGESLLWIHLCATGTSVWLWASASGKISFSRSEVLREFGHFWSSTADVRGCQSHLKARVFKRSTNTVENLGPLNLVSFLVELLDEILTLRAQSSPTCTVISSLKCHPDLWCSMSALSEKQQ